MSKERETNVMIEYIFHNKYTNKDEEYEYCLSEEEAGEVAKDYLEWWCDVNITGRRDNTDIYLMINNLICFISDSFHADMVIEDTATKMRDAYGEDRFEEIFGFKAKAQEEFEEYIDDCNAAGEYNEE